MKRKIIGVVLSIMMFTFSALGQDMGSSSKILEAFYNDYLMMANKAFNHPTTESIAKYKELFSPELVVHQFMPPGLGGTITLNREMWLDLMYQVHLNVKETLQTNQLVIDPVGKQIAAQQTVIFSEYETGKTITSIEAMSIYSLKNVEGRLIIADLKLIFSDPGALESPPSE